MTDITNSGCIPEKKTVCALGLFDGVHRGHQLIITTAVKKAQSLDGHSAVFCFKTDTVTSKGHDGRIEMLMSDDEKHEKMAELGVEVLFSPDFALLKGMSKPYFLAGGLDPNNIADAIKQLNPYAVDVSSGIETDGTKDETKMAAFAAAVRKDEGT